MKMQKVVPFSKELKRISSFIVRRVLLAFFHFIFLVPTIFFSFSVLTILTVFWQDKRLTCEQNENSHNGWLHFAFSSFFLSFFLSLTCLVYIFNLRMSLSLILYLSWFFFYFFVALQNSWLSFFCFAIFWEKSFIWFVNSNSFRFCQTFFLSSPLDNFNYDDKQTTIGETFFRWKTVCCENGRNTNQNCRNRNQNRIL